MLIGEFARLAPKDAMAVVSGATAASMFAGFLAGPIVITALLAWTGSYLIKAIPPAASLLTSSAIYALSRWARRVPVKSPSPAA